MYLATCKHWKEKGGCDNKSCLVPEKCKNFKTGYTESLHLYRRIRKLPKVKHLFIASGFRHDLMCDAEAETYLEEICRHHISGQMKVAPEYLVDSVLELMNKPPVSAYDRFLGRLAKVNQKLEKRCYLANYFISAHPGAGLENSLTCAIALLQRRMHSEQVQDFMPLPMTASACMYYTGQDPVTGRKLYVAQSFSERKAQRALIQYKNPSNRSLIMKTLKQLKAEKQANNFFKHFRKKG